MYGNDLRRLRMEKTKYEINLKFLKNLNPEWRQVAVNLQMSQSLGQYGLHDLYSMMVQDEDIIAGEKKKNISFALIAALRTSAHSRSSISK